MQRCNFRKCEYETIQFLFSTLKKLHLCTFQNLATYRGSVSTFADLCVAIGAARRHVQRVRFWHQKPAYFLEAVRASLVGGPCCQLAVAMCDVDACS